MPRIKSVNWGLENLDTQKEFLPPYPIDNQGVKFAAGGVYSDQARFGFQDPLTHWTSGRARILNFSSVLFSEDETDDITSAFEELVALAEPDKNLGRPPICEFFVGSFLEEMVMVETVDVTIHQPTDEGDPKKIDVSLALRRYVPFSKVQIDPTKPGKESYYLVVSAAEATYEGIAKRYYGDPMLGDRLRKRHPDMPMQPTVGSKISVPSRSIILKEAVEPEFHAFDLEDEDAAEAFEAILEDRAGRTVNLDG